MNLVDQRVPRSAGFRTPDPDCAIVPTTESRQLTSRAARSLLVISATSLLLSMPLAVIYQYGKLTETATIDLEWMIRLHGFANAHGFATCGLLAWVIEDRARRRTSAATPA